MHRPSCTATRKKLRLSGTCSTFSTTAVPAAPPLHCRRSLLRRSSSALKNRFDFSKYALNLVSDSALKNRFDFSEYALNLVSDNVVLLKLFVSDVSQTFSEFNLIYLWKSMIC
ncbi:hypothetical protein L2E82_03501 [Cichorium intybus]|uniref:Uncharacterized protein n=1 Tax=Cichorium intybus TaxID=13427 RepID=A0ACB9H3Y4_CICIN|nr:hypothetical protein L2E82_03501 [Cichorium intybus]